MRILYVGSYNASFHLIFKKQYSGFEIDTIDRVSYKNIKLYVSDLEQKISQSGHVIFSRYVNLEIASIAKKLKRHNIPYSYYTDDNFFAMNRVFPEKWVDQFIRGCSSILTSTEVLSAYISRVFEYDTKQVFTLDIKAKNIPIIARKRETENLVLGFLGTGKKELYQKVLALLDEKLSRPFKVITMRELACDLPLDNIEHETFGFEPNYQSFIQRVQNYNIDILIQPADKTNPNYKYKTLNSLFLPYYLNCVTLFCDNAPYHTIREFGMSSLLVKDNDFAGAIEQFSDNEELYEEMRHQIQKIVSERYLNQSQALNEKVLASIFSEHYHVGGEVKISSIKLACLKSIFRWKRSIKKRLVVRVYCKSFPE